MIEPAGPHDAAEGTRLSSESQVFEDNCPACKTRLRIDAALAGPLSRCPKCGAVLRVVQPPPRRKKKPPSDEALGRLAFWICGAGALLMVGSVIGLFVAGLGSGSGRPAPAAPVYTPAAPAPAVAVPAPEPADDGGVAAAPDNELALGTGADWPPPLPPARERLPSPPQELPATPATPVPLSAVLSADIVDIRADVFAYRQHTPEGLVLWRAAPSDHYYVFVTMKLTNAGGQPAKLYFDPRSAQSVVRLTGPGSGSATCLGRVTGHSSALQQFDLRPWSIAAGSRDRELTVAFVVADDWWEGTLHGPGFHSGVLRLPRADQPSLESLHRLSGWWIRAPEQPLKLYYPDPVMSVLCEPEVRRLLITADGGEARLALPFADVTGTLTWSESANAGDLRFTLARGSARLSGRARLAGNNDVLILYASDEPFDQVIYTFKPY